ncbi:aldehyde dehydrogenase family protein [Halomarina ordinaria]|uniref:Aldehyde dehydrogenase family protein n=1 Tax=Halomarina ordinaria TaxID=3033939 RepID=A0ABD5U5G2_9EURY|nr:aldehyde dehydrogenase family protein [Halomarina sp. PSRA2]
MAQTTVDADRFSAEADWDVLYLDGERERGDRDALEVDDPATEEVFTTVPAGTVEDVDAAYETAAEAGREWAARPPQERAAVVERAVEVVEEHRETLVDLLGTESGSTVVKANAELDTALGMMREAVSFPTRVGGEVKESLTPGKENLAKREPVGVVGVISPWNFPFHLSMRAVAPALALGNGVVLKPASTTPITGGLLLARLFEAAGLPEGLLNVVPGHGSDIGDRMAGHPEASVVAFTGSTGVGKGVAKQAVDHLAYPAMELGGNNPHVVLSDADVDAAVDSAVFGSFLHQGQICISINRHLVHESVYDEYVEKLTERAASLPVGDPHDPDTVVGPIIDDDQRDQILAYVEETVEQGATLETGGEAEGRFVEPTVLSGATNDMSAACNEHFGPVAPVVPVADDEEAVELANDTEYGLAASVHSTDRERAERVADRIDAGMVHINDQPVNDEPHVPFGGVKASGIGRFNGEYIMEELTRTKWVSVQRDERDYPF